jgi:hypothetical protein
MSLSSNKNCIWSSNKCVSTSKKATYWWQSFNVCYQTSKNLINEKYCGNENRNFPISDLTLDKIDNKYGKNNLYCRWKITVPEKDFYVYFTKETSETTYDYFVIERLKKDGSRDFKDLTKYLELNLEMENSIFPDKSKISQIIFHYFGNAKNTKNSFKVSITDSNTKVDFITIFVVLGVLIVTILICVIIIYRCRQAYLLRQQEDLERAIQAENLHMNNFDIINNNLITTGITKEKIIEDNLEKIKLLLMSKLKPIQYSDRLNKNNDICTICLETFNSSSIVVRFNICKHLFHFNCLNDSLMKNAENPRCPNCNSSIFEEMNVPDDYNNVEIENLKNDNIENNNSKNDNSFSGKKSLKENKENQITIINIIKNENFRNDENINDNTNSKAKANTSNNESANNITKTNEKIEIELRSNND